MERLPVTRVKPGQCLAEPVCDGEGRVLLGAGVVLTQNKILMLRQRGVMLATVESGSDEGGAAPEAPAEPLDPESLRRIVLEHGRRFGDTRKDPVMDAVFRAVINRATRGQIG